MPAGVTPTILLVSFPTQTGESAQSDLQRLAGNGVLTLSPALLIPAQTPPSPVGLTGDRGVSVCLSVSRSHAHQQRTGAQSWGGMGREPWIFVKGRGMEGKQDSGFATPSHAFLLGMCLNGVPTANPLRGRGLIGARAGTPHTPHHRLLLPPATLCFPGHFSICYLGRAR